jgi:hypothetical protein
MDTMEAFGSAQEDKYLSRFLKGSCLLPLRPNTCAEITDLCSGCAVAQSLIYLTLLFKSAIFYILYCIYILR